MMVLPGPVQAAFNVYDLLSVFDAGQLPTVPDSARTPGPVKRPVPRALPLDDTTRWVDPNGLDLSDRLWNAKADTREAIARKINYAVATKQSPELLARDLEQYLHARYKPSRDAKGRLTSKEQPGLLTSNGRGVGSYHARRLARTEVTRANALGKRIVAERSPYITGERWRAAHRHPDTHVCRINELLGARPVGEIPLPPAHPFCVCRVEHVRGKNAVAVRSEVAIGVAELERLLTP